MMMMKSSDIYEPFFALLRAGLWDHRPDGTFSMLTAGQWERLYIMACRQTVEGIVFDGLLQLPVKYFPPRPLLLRWTALVDHIERNNHKVDGVVAELTRIFTDHDITACLLKGQGVAACYSNPSHRVSGDIDWYFPCQGDFKKANKLMVSLGISLKKNAGFSVSYIWQGILVEHHSRMFDFHNPFLATFLRQLEVSEVYNSSSLRVNSQSVLLPSPLLAHLQVNAHILKHQLSYGIGLRQLCDSACLCRATSMHVDAVHLQEVYNKAGILAWIVRLYTFLVREIGLPVEFLPFSLPARLEIDFMKQDILHSGNFGFYACYPDTIAAICKTDGRSNVARSLFRHFWLNLRYAPGEACWFPLVHVYSHLLKYIS
ncbi:MAG: nucleotidyltransferase family protein [Bacteroides sp.]|jgi:hypothetical protein|nr:nucleotidyltransferase family protein [Bacteroides sp.]MCI1684039.1 nucleotidyltransferase family protein [Bacteroides sp.]